MYSASRLMTMMEVNLWPLTMSEQDIPVLFPSSIALTTSTTSGRVPLWDPNIPSTLTSIQSMSKWSLTIHSYEYLSTNVVTMEHLLIMVKPTALMEEKPLEDTLAMPIPPKPLHSAARAETTTIIAPVKQLQQQCPPDMMWRSLWWNLSHQNCCIIMTVPPTQLQEGPARPNYFMSWGRRTSRSHPPSTATQWPTPTINLRSKNCILLSNAM